MLWDIWPLLWNNPVHCEDVLLSSLLKRVLVNSYTGFGDRENAGEKGEEGEMQSKQDDKYVHEVKKPGAAHRLIEMG